jgi:hypothetical protein
MNPELIVETLGVEAISKHAPTHVVWACLARTGSPPPATALEPAATALEPAAASPPPPSPRSSLPLPAPPEPTGPAPTGLDLFDDDVASVFVELDDASGMMEVTRDPASPAAAGAPDDKKKTGFARTTKRA